MTDAEFVRAQRRALEAIGRYLLEGPQEASDGDEHPRGDCPLPDNVKRHRYDEGREVRPGAVARLYAIEWLTAIHGPEATGRIKAADLEVRSHNEPESRQMPATERGRRTVRTLVADLHEAERAALARYERDRTRHGERTREGDGPDGERLERLARRIETMHGAGDPIAGRQRNNEPSTQQRRERGDHGSREMIRAGDAGPAVAVLNLAEEWNDKDRVGGIVAATITAMPNAAREALRELRAEEGARGPHEVARRVLGLDEAQAGAFFDGPASAGAARRWIGPDEAAEAVRRTAAGDEPGRVWKQIDRRALYEAAGAEDLSAYDNGVVEERLEAWVEQRGENVAELYPQTEYEPAEHEAPTAGEREEARAEIVEQLRGEAGDGLIHPGADIHPTARIENTRIAGPCTVGAGAIVRNADIEAGCVIGNGAKVEHARLGENCRIGDGCEIDRADLHDGAAVGRNSRIAGQRGNRAEVGENAQVGAGCVLEKIDGYAPYVPANTRVHAGAVNTLDAAAPTGPDEAATSQTGAPIETEKRRTPPAHPGAGTASEVATTGNATVEGRASTAPPPARPSPMRAYRHSQEAAGRARGSHRPPR